jgi:hypothetical protein
MEVITDQPTTWPCSHVVLSRFSFLFCFVLFYTALLPRHTLDTSFSRPLYVIPFFFLLFFLLSLVFSPLWPLTCADVETMVMVVQQHKHKHKHPSLTAGLWCTVLYGIVMYSVN